MIREAYRATCEFCKGDLDTGEEGVYRWVAGWVKNRDGGGGHGISCPVRSDRYAHHHCVVNAARGFTGQTDLFK